MVFRAALVYFPYTVLEARIELGREGRLPKSGASTGVSRQWSRRLCWSSVTAPCQHGFVVIKKKRKKNPA
ncbi:hypothetical protein CTA1_11334 [Colletotrichum tanaceti]|uniref:Uncharacterized protein n=1 Tax=Colletotrichum tanaceti TaxID=1306861 RepID=A0A4U6XDY6_9PEZI|nr:hypothetical protein CTA1_11334 [Colletotrichum tanaceti]